MKSEGKSVILDARETAPGGSSEDMFVGHETDTTLGPLAIAVPGELKGLHVSFNIHKKQLQNKCNC